MRPETNSEISSKPALRWWITCIWNSSVRWRRTILVLSALIIPALFLSSQDSLPPDYRAYFNALDADKAARHLDVLERLEGVWRSKPVSPLTGRAALVAARAYVALGRGRDAFHVLKKYAASDPESLAALAPAAEATGDKASAAGYWQRLYYEWPLSDQAVGADAALSRLRIELGESFPPAMPGAVFARAEKLRRAGQAARARRDLLSASADFGGLDRELALVRAETGDYRALSLLKVSSPDAEAERLYLMHAVSRRNSAEAAAEAAMRQLDSRYPKSPWTMEALVSWGNHHLLRNNVADYVPLYRACFERFPNDPQAAYCHWKVAWSRWIARAPDAREWLEQHLARYPESEKRSAALYFLGRYSAAVTQHPMSWYAVLAREKLKAARAAAPAKPDPAQWTPNATTRLRLARAKQLREAMLSEWAEFELKFAATEQPWVASMELADAAADRGLHDQALRYIKAYAKGYLSLALEEAPERFWRLAFPMPYRSDVERTARAQELDPFLVAALIRQESEFNPRAVSRAKAYGLTQVLPSTGRQLSRRAGIYGFRPTMLFEPDVNLKLGTMHLRSMLDAHQGSIEVTLAAYNAGKTRTDLWTSWYDYKEPAEFVETIPFSETRNYVQIVLRNADVYRRVYGTTRRAASY